MLWRQCVFFFDNYQILFQTADIGLLLANIVPEVCLFARIELHHLTQTEPGAMIEIMGSKHDKYSKQLHGMISAGESFRNNEELSAQYEKFRKEYWKKRIEDVENAEKTKCLCSKKGG